MPPSDHDIREIHLSLERQYARIQSILTRLTALESHLARITALESRTCNCSAASSAGSGGTDGSASFDASATANKSSAESAFGAASTPPDPVSAAIRDDPKPAPVAKAEPHAETAEEVAEQVVKDLVARTLCYVSPGERAVMRECAIIAIKRERGEA